MSVTITPTRNSLPIERDLLRRCVHCGLCLPTCPTYDVLGDERDSPRGRLFQMKAAADGVVPLDDPSLNRHLSRCLDCRACETACPSGVQYGRVLEEMRAILPTPSGVGGALGKVVLGTVFMDPQLLDTMGKSMRLAQRLGVFRVARSTGLMAAFPQRWGQLAELLPAFQPAVPLPVHMSARGTRRARVGLITGCVMKQAFGATTAATAQVLAINGCDVVIPPIQGCCGALHTHTGNVENARILARRMIDAFPDDLDAIIINAAGCGSTLKEYGHILHDDPDYAERAAAFATHVRDISEWLDTLGLIPPTQEIKLKVTYQDACHLRHAQRIREQPRRLLQAIPGIELVEMEGSQDCCGSAGVYNLTQYDLSMQLLDKKMTRIAATGARTVVVGNPGCAIQIMAGARARRQKLSVVHPVDLLARAYNRSSQKL